ncbi:Immunoglobulin A1 protease autotransporter, partial [Frankliniella fusca]
PGLRPTLLLTGVSCVSWKESSPSCWLRCVEVAGLSRVNVWRLRIAMLVAAVVEKLAIPTGAVGYLLLWSHNQIALAEHIGFGLKIVQEAEGIGLEVADIAYLRERCNILGYSGQEKWCHGLPSTCSSRNRLDTFLQSGRLLVAG